VNELTALLASVTFCKINLHSAPGSIDEIGRTKVYMMEGCTPYIDCGCNNDDVNSGCVMVFCVPGTHVELLIEVGIIPVILCFPIESIVSFGARERASIQVSDALRIGITVKQKLG
jgi:hypothetical protein